MPMFRLPLSGNVNQSILPWNWFFNPVGSQFGLINIELGRSADPELEEEILRDVASYGRQLGRIEEALVSLIDAYREKRDFTQGEEQTIADLKSMMADIDKVKRYHRKE
jgi:hypothetical protein